MRNKWVIIWSGLYNCRATVNKYPNVFYSMHYRLLLIFRLILIPQLYSICKEQPTISSRYFFFKDWCRSRNWLAMSLYWSLSCWQVSSSLERISNASFLLSSFLLHTRYCRKGKRNKITVASHLYPSQYLIQHSQVLDWEDRRRFSAWDQTLSQVLLAYC